MHRGKDGAGLPREGSISSMEEKSKCVKNAAESEAGSIPSKAHAASADRRPAIFAERCLKSQGRAPLQIRQFQPIQQNE